MTTTYNRSQLLAEITGISYTDKQKFLDSLNLTPTAEFNTGKRTYRLYDDAALNVVLKAVAERNAAAKKEKLARAAKKGTKASMTIEESLAELHRKVDMLLDAATLPDFSKEPQQ